MSNKSLTVVLPVYNRESNLGRSVSEILELASELTRQFEILIIDDGSTDATYEVAEELASRFPQISLQRHRHRRGLGATLASAGRRMRSDVVIVHDGVTRINPEEVRQLWRDRVESPLPTKADNISTRSGWISELDRLPDTHTAMERAHGRVLGFQLLVHAVENGSANSAAEASSSPRHWRDTQHAERPNIGTIPSLPRPKFLTSLADFALGE